MILSHHSVNPVIPSSVYVAPSADIIGDVEIGEQSSVWFNVVIRGDVNFIRIGARTNIQDGSVLHVTRQKFSLHLGDDVTVGHSVTLHGCRVGNRVLIGMGAIVLDGAEVADDCMIAAGCLVPQGMKVPSGVLVMGMPAQIKRALTDEEIAFLRQSAKNYVGDAEGYRLPSA